MSYGGDVVVLGSWLEDRNSKQASHADRNSNSKPRTADPTASQPHCRRATVRWRCCTHPVILAGLGVSHSACLTHRPITEPCRDAVQSASGGSDDSHAASGEECLVIGGEGAMLGGRMQYSLCMGGREKQRRRERHVWREDGGRGSPSNIRSSGCVCVSHSPPTHNRVLVAATVPLHNHRTMTDPPRERDC